MADPVRREPASPGADAAPASTAAAPAAAPAAADAAPAPTREALLQEHAEARRRRNASVLGSHEWEAASADVGRIEVEIARIERAMDPPRV
jgi:hypothetical protein